MGPPYRRGPPGSQRAVCELWGAPSKAGPSPTGLCDAGDGPEQLRNADVAKIPELDM